MQCCWMYSEMKAELKMTGDVGSPTPPRQEVCSFIFTLMSKSGYSRCTAAPGPSTGCRTIWCKRQGTAFYVHGGRACVVCRHSSLLHKRRLKKKLDVVQTFQAQCFSVGRDCGAVRGAEPAPLQDPCSLPCLWSWFWSQNHMLIQQP